MKKYEELKRYFNDNFSLGYLNTGAGNKLALISLVCYLTEKAKEKKPNVTVYQILYNLNKDINLPEDFIIGLTIICEDLMNGTHDFPTFGVENKNIINSVKEVLKTYLPF